MCCRSKNSVNHPQQRQRGHCTKGFWGWCSKKRQQPQQPRSQMSQSNAAAGGPIFYNNNNSVAAPFVRDVKEPVWTENARDLKADEDVASSTTKSDVKRRASGRNSDTESVLSAPPMYTPGTPSL
ncbi:hypothetical protein FRB95_010566 [Tulasnella sp. JGI-2019a]|nr:hypothetical protein FRB95_010566 [Tulasnella sp. JGI-2019a]